MKRKHIQALEFVWHHARDMYGAYTGDPDPTYCLHYQKQLRLARKAIRYLKSHKGMKSKT